MPEAKQVMITERKVPYEERAWRNAPRSADTWTEVSYTEEAAEGERVVSMADVPEDEMAIFEKSVGDPDGHIEDIEYDRTTHAVANFARKLETLPVGEAKAASLTDGVDSRATRMVGYDFLRRKGVTGKGVLVAVGDTGVDAKHFSRQMKNRFTGRHWTGYADGLDRHSHGSWCSAAAVPRSAKWTFGKVLGDNGSGKLSDAAKFCYWVVNEAKRLGIKKIIISFSLSAPGRSKVMSDAIDHVLVNNGLVLCANGNDSANEPGTPSAEQNAVSVAATDYSGRKASFSNLMAHKSRRGLAGPGVGVQGVNGTKSGTSMATPVAAKVGAAMFQKSFYATNLIALLFQTADSGSRQQIGWGVVNGEAAYTKHQKQNENPAPEPEDPEATPAPPPVPEEPAKNETPLNKAHRRLRDSWAVRAWLAKQVRYERGLRRKQAEFVRKLKGES